MLLKRCGNSSHPYLVSHLKVNAFSASRLNMIFGVAFCRFSLSGEDISFYFCFAETFFLNHKWMLNFIKLSHLLKYYFSSLFC